MSSLTGWSLWRWPRSPAPDAGLYESVPSESCCCGPEPGAAWPWCGRRSAFDPVSTAWPPSVPPSPEGLDPMELRPQTTGFQVRSRVPAALQSDPPAPQHPWNTTTGVCQLFYFISTFYFIEIKIWIWNLSTELDCTWLWFVLVTLKKIININHIESFVSSSVFMPLIELYEDLWKITYHKDGLAMRLGLGRALARLGEPEGDELRVSTLGSSSSISSTSSCRSTSWSRMHLTEYCPKTLSCVATKRRQWCDACTIKPDVCF